MQGQELTGGFRVLRNPFQVRQRIQSLVKSGGRQKVIYSRVFIRWVLGQRGRCAPFDALKIRPRHIHVTAHEIEKCEIPERFLALWCIASRSVCAFLSSSL
jgi:hypothetical protein